MAHMDNLFRDLRYALRNLRKDPRFVFAAIFALALGIGSSTVMFSVAYNVLFDAFPYKELLFLKSTELLSREKPPVLPSSGILQISRFENDRALRIMFLKR